VVVISINSLKMPCQLAAGLRGEQRKKRQEGHQEAHKS